MANTSDFNIYYLNFSKVYEIAMMINNVILTKIEKDNTKSFEEQYGFTSSIAAQGNASFLAGVKASISSSASENSFSSSRVMETLEVKTTKSILLRRVIKQCKDSNSPIGLNEGQLIKVNAIKLDILDEESLRQLLILRRDALKGVRIEGMELNNLISSMLQDYAYILKGTITDSSIATAANEKHEIIIKIPLEMQTEFENKYSINDLLIGKVSIVGIYKGIVQKDFITSNTFNYLQESGKQKAMNSDKVILSDSIPIKQPDTSDNCGNPEYHFIDVLSIIQDVSFDYGNPSTAKLRWWNKLGLWLSNLKRG